MKNMGSLAKAWVLAAQGWGMIALADEGAAQAQKAEDPGDGTKGKAPAAAQDPDYAVVRKFLRGRGLGSWDGIGREREGSPEAALPPEIERSLVQLARRNPQERRIWESMRTFMQWTAAQIRVGNSRMACTREMISVDERVAHSVISWQMRAKALMDLARAGRLSGDVYQEARRSLEEELQKALIASEREQKKSEVVTKETARLILECLEPDLKDPQGLPEPLRRRIADRIGRLGDLDFKNREEALQDLIAIGEPALGSLRLALEHPDPEVAARARSAWEKILGGEE